MNFHVRHMILLVSSHKQRDVEPCWGCRACLIFDKDEACALLRIRPRLPTYTHSYYWATQQLCPQKLSHLTVDFAVSEKPWRFLGQRLRDPRRTNSCSSILLLVIHYQGSMWLIKSVLSEAKSMSGARFVQDHWPSDLRLQLWAVCMVVWSLCCTAMRHYQEYFLISLIYHSQSPCWNKNILWPPFLQPNLERLSSTTVHHLGS